MAKNGIYFDRVWKKFKRGDHVDVLHDWVARLLRRAVLGADDLKRNEFWAVRDISFEVRPGEALGIIGPNGAGKSTVLKLLTRILRPEKGRCELRGRVGSLIEISAGFHPDLTGRENVFLQGAIMGMKRREVREKFDAIVEFSGVSEFIDTPVRRYSSGMNARLGFSIAAHLEPEILIIDEVLSVGDYAFQQRAFGRMKEMISRDVAAVMVSHAMERVATLCERAILLRGGRVAFEGEATDTISAYIDDVSDTPDAVNDVPIGIDGLRILAGDLVRPGGQVLLRLTGRVLDGMRARDTAEIVVRIRSAQGIGSLFTTSNVRQDVALPPTGTFEIEIELEMNLPPGLYVIETSIYDKGKPVAKGPRAAVTVGPDPSFAGRTFARPAMRLVSQHALEASVASSAR